MTWRPITTAPKDGSAIWLGNTMTGQMRIGVWQHHALLNATFWADQAISETLGPAEIKFEPDCLRPLPPKPAL